jgi:hypothetical protein
VYHGFRHQTLDSCHVDYADELQRVGLAFEQDFPLPDAIGLGFLFQVAVGLGFLLQVAIGLGFLLQVAIGLGFLLQGAVGSHVHWA